MKELKVGDRVHINGISPIGTVVKIDDEAFYHVEYRNGSGQPMCRQFIIEELSRAHDKQMTQAEADKQNRIAAESDFDGDD